jgi:hypothetical protein
MTLADLLKDLIETSKERVKTPISSAYVLSFTLWNWRPISLLFIENATITQKISVINAEYCTASAIIGPFLLGLFFTIGVPYIMALIDVMLQPAKKWRLQNLYKSKKAVLQNQILLADIELELQDKKSRNKEKEDFQLQIQDLEKRIESTSDSHKAIVDSYEKRLFEMTETLNKTTAFQKNSNTTKNDVHFVNILIDSNFSPNDIEKINRLPNNNKDVIDFIKIGYTVMNFLKDNMLVEEKGDNMYYLTKIGLEFRNWTINNKIKSVKDIM